MQSIYDPKNLITNIGRSLNDEGRSLALVRSTPLLERVRSALLPLCLDPDTHQVYSVVSREGPPEVSDAIGRLKVKVEKYRDSPGVILDELDLRVWDFLPTRDGSFLDPFRVRLSCSYVEKPERAQLHRLDYRSNFVWWSKITGTSLGDVQERVLPTEWFLREREKKG